ncbi:MAG TPA: pyruvate kinase, partial [Gemmiger qucibialis]|nr:pyruvate kinase [Gemmiger qucibialis]
MRKTKIVCTLGPSTDQPGILRQLLENGMNVARFNFSHGDYAEHKGRLDQLRALSKELDVSIPAMLDTKGPEIRLGEFENGKEQLTALCSRMDAPELPELENGYEQQLDILRERTLLAERTAAEQSAQLERLRS